MAHKIVKADKAAEKRFEADRKRDEARKRKKIRQAEGLKR